MRARQELYRTYQLTVTAENKKLTCDERLGIEGFRCEGEMSPNAVRKLNLLRTVGRSQDHDEGLTQRAKERMGEGDEWEMEDDMDIEKINKGIQFFSDNFFSMFVSMLTGKDYTWPILLTVSVRKKFFPFLFTFWDSGPCMNKTTFS